MKYIFTSLLLFLLISNTAFAAPLPTSNFYINDFAGVMSQSDKDYIQNKAVAIHEQYDGTQIVVVITKSLEGQSIEEYALDIFNQWGIGQRGKDNGALLLVVPGGERGGRMRIEVGYGLEGVLTDGTAGYILDEFVMPHYTKGDYSTAVKQGFDKIAEIVSGEFVVPQDYTNDAVYSEGMLPFISILMTIALILLIPAAHGDFPRVVGLIIHSVFAVVCFVMPIIDGSLTRFLIDSKYNVVWMWVGLGIIHAIFFVLRCMGKGGRGNGGSWGSGSSWSGGSSWSSGSSGSSYSGGGGSSGGGGASR